MSIYITHTLIHFSLQCLLVKTIFLALVRVIASIYTFLHTCSHIYKQQSRFARILMCFAALYTHDKFERMCPNVGIQFPLNNVCVCRHLYSQVWASTASCASC